MSLRLLSILLSLSLVGCIPVSRDDLPSEPSSPTPIVETPSPTPAVTPSPTSVDQDGDGHDLPEDCDDQDDQVYPGAPERCNGEDDDCDDVVDPVSPPPSDATAWYPDEDGDGVGEDVEPVLACAPPEGFVDESGDCDDLDPDAYPGAAETCAAGDQDCDGEADESPTDAQSWYPDGDEDGYGTTTGSVTGCVAPDGYSSAGGDCDDGDASRYPGAAERCDGVDQDCDGQTDESPIDAKTWYADADEDGWGDTSRSLKSCMAPNGYVNRGGDCDDDDPSRHPEAVEACNLLDDDCDGQTDEGMPDLDGSGFADCIEVAVIVSGGFQSSGDPVECEDVSVVERELAEISTFLEDLGLRAVPILEDWGAGVTWAQIQYYPLIVYDDGGSSGAAPKTTVSTLQQAASAGKGLIFVGDDLAKQADKTEDEQGTHGFWDLIWLSKYLGSGVGGYGTVVVDGAHPVMSGPYGTVQGFNYREDLDWSAVAGRGEKVLMKVEALGYPAVLAAESGAQRTVVMLPVIYATAETCPVTDGKGLGMIEALFKNAVTWILAG